VEELGYDRHAGVFHFSGDFKARWRLRVHRVDRVQEYKRLKREPANSEPKYAGNEQPGNEPGAWPRQPDKQRKQKYELCNDCCSYGLDASGANVGRQRPMTVMTGERGLPPKAQWDHGTQGN
jgi:hypothetical protein